MKRVKVKLLQAIAGVGIHHSDGEIIEVSEAEAKRMIEKRIAVPIASKPEKAAKK